MPTPLPPPPLPASTNHTFFRPCTQEWEFEISDEEAHRRRLAEWMRYQPNTPGTDQSLDDLKKSLPPKDFDYVRELAENPPRKAYPANWPVNPNA